MTPPLQTTWQAQHAAGEPTAVIRVRNLQSTIQGPQDAWGRRDRLQPILVSAEVSLHERFGSSSSKDAVDSDTVHYGLLSKAILSTLGHLDADAEKGRTLRNVLDNLWMDLIGFSFTGGTDNNEERKPFLNVAVVRSLSISLELPKASLLGSGISLSATAVYGDEGSRTSSTAAALSLNLKGLRIPTLIGVNDNERTAKQVVVTDISVEKWQENSDEYAWLEQTVVDCIKDTTFETLEALADVVAGQMTSDLKERFGEHDWQIRIGLEKPTAVVLADAACVELRVNVR